LQFDCQIVHVGSTRCILSCMSMRLAFKLSSILVLGMVAVLAIEAYQAVRREREFFRADMQHDAQLLGRSLMGPIADVWRISGEQRALELIRDANRQERVVHIRWVWLDAMDSDSHKPCVDRQQLLAVARGEEASFPSSSPISGGRLLTYIPMRVPGGRPGALELSESFSQLENYSRTTISRALGVMGALMAFGAGGVVCLGAVVVGRPLRRLVLAVRRIGHGDLGVRIENVRHDELGELAGALNDMCQQLADARAAVRVETERRISALEQLRHADRLSTVGRLAAGVAHEVGTPLNVISARAKQLAGGELTQADAREYAITVGKQSERIATTIRQLLGFARSGQEARRLQNLAEIVDRGVELLQPLARKRGAVLRVTAPTDDLVVTADTQQLEQVVANLVMNAVQAVALGGHVDVRVFQSPASLPDGRETPTCQYACFSVSDDGVGIQRKDLDRIFEPFFTTKDVGEGTGLGLSLAHEIVRDHGGRIDVTSQPGAGTCFVVYLPMSTRAQPTQCCSVS
jgi:two-component system NtrC family sensor kinase